MRAILTYHSIDTSGSVISTPPEVFERQVRWMAERHVPVVSLADLLASDAGDAIAITFDDGFANFLGAAERLTRDGLPVTVFVVTGHVGGSNAWGGRDAPGIPTLPLLGWSDLDRLAATGVTVGAHTRTHADLTTLSSSAVEDEMEGSAAELRRRFGRSPLYFAYPYGAIDDRVAALAAGRFSASMTTQFGPVTPHDARERIPRLDMYYFQRPGGLEAWGTRRFDRRLWSVRARRRIRRALTAGRSQ